MAQQGRLNAILELVTTRGTVSIQEIVDELNVSAATARRDLNSLSDERLVTRTHGGGMALGSGYELPLQYKIARNADEKLAIAKAAVALIGLGATVGINGGTTTTEVARELGRSEHLISSGEEPGVTVVTNALNIAFELSVRQHVKIVATGGVARRQSYELVGPLVGNTIKELSFDFAILGVDGLSAGFGATTIHEGEAEVSRQIAQAAAQVIVVADASKLGVSTFARICDLSAIDILVTTNTVSADFRAALEDASVTVIVAD
ncbi:DeoR/GlpR family DNA-binding transcription regulator [Salinibacterium sp.]|uniref:DeoR/GlpR family DNA-binding transcription regulator n=1 Tax=Salinibacterium sp. TaxID=1915057 RepID=UPI00286B5A78|nr:DeoR/GlpR family DNA-binding transcription regulator [Salinibacterium sp.]